MTYLTESAQDRYQANMRALAECINLGVSEQSINQLAFEAGIDKRDIQNILQNGETKCLKSPK